MIVITIEQIKKQIIDVEMTIEFIEKTEPVNKKEISKMKEKLKKLHKLYEKEVKKELKRLAKRPNRYERKMIGKRKINKLQKEAPNHVCNNGEHKKKVYYSNRRKIARKKSERKVRNFNGYIPSGGTYRKIYNIWNDIL